MTLTSKQRRFVDHYLVEPNAAMAARRAGYSEANAFRAGWKNLKVLAVRKALDAADTKRKGRDG